MKPTRIFALFIFLLLLTSCQSTTTTSYTSTATNMGAQALSVDELLAQAHSLPSPTKERYQLQAVDKLIQTRNLVQAQSLLLVINTTGMPVDITATKIINQATIDLLLGSPEQTLSQLSQINAPEQLPNALLVKVLNLRAQAYGRNNQPLMEIRSRIALTPLLAVDTTLGNENLRSIWQTLMQIPTEQLANLASDTSQQDVYSGWLQLVYLTKTQNLSADSFDTALNDWILQHPYHPASALLSDGFDATFSSTTPFNPQHITLLLPIKGPLANAATATRDGFFTAFYADEFKNADITISVLDTDNDENVIERYQEALNSGTELVIGPLTKNGVDELELFLSGRPPNIPIIALNYDEQDSTVMPTPASFYQFGLAPEDEARQAARHAWQSGYFNAAIITADSQWGERLSTAFTDEWHLLGGELVNKVSYQSEQDLQTPVRELLNINMSEQRAASLRQLLREDFEYQPRRRADIDVIFMAAIPTYARQINPLLSFYFANTIPVYATSSIYSGTPNPTTDEDMQGIVFCDAPWVIDAEHSFRDLHDNIAQLWPQTTATYARLYALGVDSYQLISQLPRLNLFPGLALSGATGQLTLNEEQRQIIRTLPCAQFIGGEPKLLSTMVL